MSAHISAAKAAPVTAPVIAPVIAIVRTSAIALAFGAASAAAYADTGVVVDTTYQPFSGGVTILFNGTVFSNTAGAFQLNGTSASDTVYVDTSGDAVKLSAGDLIGPSLFAPAGASSQTPVLEPTATKGAYFVALHVNSGAGVDNYGYAEVQAFIEAPPVVLGYGFQTDANTPISAGEGLPVPEPASLALLASGVAGVAAIRRRRKRALR